MGEVLHTLIYEHNLRFVALAVGICALASLTSAGIAQYSLTEQASSRRRWLLLGSVVTGLGIWTTHFTLLLGYRGDLDIHFKLKTIALSLFLSVALTVIAGCVGLLGRPRGILAGTIIGVGIAISHLLDLQAMRPPGGIVQDPKVNIVAVACGMFLAGLAGHCLVRSRNHVFAWPAAVSLSAAIFALHIIAMSGVTVVPASDPVEPGAWIASVDQLSIVVVAAFLIILFGAIFYTWHSERLAQATAREQSRYIRTLEVLRETEDHHRAYIELNPQIAWVADPQGRVTEIAPLWSQLVGLPREASVGQGWADVVHPDDIPGVIELWRNAIEAGEGKLADVRYRVRLVDGEYRWFRARARPRRNAEGTIVAWYGTLEDIHEQVLSETALRESEERYQLASRATNDIIWDWSIERERARWAGAHQEVLGYPELQHETDLNWWLDRIYPEDRPRVLASQALALEQGADYWNEEYRFLNASGDWIDVRTRCVIVRNNAGEAVRLVGSMLDVTQQKKAEAELNWAAHHDPLTKLPNRTLYRKQKLAAIDSAARSGTFVALVLLDLNGFKELNDSLGHAAGDSVLWQTAERLRNSLPASATVARLGGDEFAIILPGLPTPEAYKETIDNALQALGEPFTFGDQSIPASVSAGVAIWPRDGGEPESLLIAADLALYASKAEMPGTVLEFTPALKGAAERRSGMLARARQALKEDSIVPFYQPKVDLKSNRVTGWEALLRIRGEGDRILPPSEISAAFSDAELAVQLTDRMLALVFADLKRWKAEGVSPGRIAVNVSAADFRQNDLLDRLRRHASASDQDLASVDIEVTETVLIGELGPDVARMLQELRQLGMAVALDDFGTGYASLTHLQDFPVDVIKIDRSFVERIDDNEPKATAVIDAILQMANRLGMATVAEGIETDEQARYLRGRGCTLGQGYLYSRPVPATDVPRMLSAITEPLDYSI